MTNYEEKTGNDANTVSNPIDLHNKNVVYPKNNSQQEIEKLYSEIRNYTPDKDDIVDENNDNEIYASKQNMISDAYKKYDINRFKVNNGNNKIRENKYLQNQFSSYVSQKQKYRELEEKVNILLQKGDDIFVASDALTFGMNLHEYS